MRTPYTRSLFNKAGKLANSLPIRNLRRISRDYNKDADVLTRRALLQVNRDSEKYDQTIRQIDPHEKMATINAVGLSVCWICGRSNQLWCKRGNEISKIGSA